MHIIHQIRHSEKNKKAACAKTEEKNGLRKNREKNGLRKNRGKNGLRKNRGKKRPAQKRRPNSGSSLGEKIFYPFTPPWMTPFSILSWKKGKAMMMGAMAAMITANWIR